MFTRTTIFASSFICTAILYAQSDQGFSGRWKLDEARSDIRPSSQPPAAFLDVTQAGDAVTFSATGQDGGVSQWTYPLDGKEAKRQVGDSVMKTITKWEGPALLVNTIVSGPRNYVLMERWVRSRDGSRLTIKQTIARASGESESVLVYQNTSMVSPPTLVPPERPLERTPSLTAPSSFSVRERNEPPAEFVVESGTRILLRLINSVNTKHTSAGDRVYLQTAYPVSVNGRIVIPSGSNVSGTVTESQRPGRVKGKASLYIRFDSLLLPNGTTRDLRSRVGSADAKVDRSSEGKLEGDGGKGRDAKTVGETTAAGAGVGTLAGAASGHYGMGAGIGAAAGAVGGLIGVLGSRGPELVLRPGSTMEMILDRDLRFTAVEIGR